MYGSDRESACLGASGCQREQGGLADVHGYDIRSDAIHGQHHRHFARSGEAAGDVQVNLIEARVLGLQNRRGHARDGGDYVGVSKQTSTSRGPMAAVELVPSVSCVIPRCALSLCELLLALAIEARFIAVQC